MATTRAASRPGSHRGWGGAGLGRKALPAPLPRPALAVPRPVRAEQLLIHLLLAHLSLPRVQRRARWSLHPQVQQVCPQQRGPPALTAPARLCLRPRFPFARVLVWQLAQRVAPRQGRPRAARGQGEGTALALARGWSGAGMLQGLEGLEKTVGRGQRVLRPHDAQGRPGSWMMWLVRREASASRHSARLFGPPSPHIALLASTEKGQRYYACKQGMRHLAYPAT